MTPLTNRSVRGPATVLAGIAGALFALRGGPLGGRAGEKPAGPEAVAAKQEALFNRLQVREAWEVTRGDPKVLVGIIDNGFDYFHPDLKGQLLPGYYYPGGYHAEFYEALAHGTLVASLIVAREGNPDGMVGLAPRCRALTASQGMIEHTLVKRQNQFFREHPTATFADWQKEFLMPANVIPAVRFAWDWVHYQTVGAAEAIRYLVDHGARVINFSGGLRKSLCPSAADWQKLEDAFAYAARKNVVIVLAAGNDAARWEDYPGSSETVLVAGATLLNDRRWEEEVDFRGKKIKQGSNYGKRLTVMAPVEKLVVCVPHEKRFYDCDDGPMGPMRQEFKGRHDVLRVGATSCAAPVVTALVGLVCSARPGLDARTVVEIVCKGCDDIGPEGYDEHTGHGRVNFARTLRLAQDWGK
jgi:subtilisin family serine protease